MVGQRVAGCERLRGGLADSNGHQGGWPSVSVGTPVHGPSGRRGGVRKKPLGLDQFPGWVVYRGWRGPRHPDKHHMSTSSRTRTAYGRKARLQNGRAASVRGGRSWPSEVYLTIQTDAAGRSSAGEVTLRHRAGGTHEASASLRRDWIERVRQRSNCPCDARRQSGSMHPAVHHHCFWRLARSGKSQCLTT